MEMEFNTLKFFKSDYSFNRKQMEQYLNKVLLKGCGVYMDEYEKIKNEKIHVFFSWMLLFKFLSYILLGIVVLLIFDKVNIFLTTLLFGISIITKIISYFLDKKIIQISSAYKFSTSIIRSDNYEFLEQIRQDLLKEKSN